MAANPTSHADKDGDELSPLATPARKATRKTGTNAMWDPVHIENPSAVINSTSRLAGYLGFRDTRAMYEWWETPSINRLLVLVIQAKPTNYGVSAASSARVSPPTFPINPALAPSMEISMGFMMEISIEGAIFCWPCA